MSLKPSKSKAFMRFSELLDVHNVLLFGIGSVIMSNRLYKKYTTGNNEFMVNSLPVSTDVEICKIMSNYEIVLGYRPTVLFNNVVDYKYNVLMNPFKREQIKRNMKIQNSQKWLDELYNRYSTQAKKINFDNDVSSLQKIERISSIPILKHQMNDCGFYITTGISITRDIESNNLNMGIYRIRIDNNRSSIFIANGSDGYRNLQKYTAEKLPMPVTITIGAEMSYYLLAAAKLPYNVDDFNEANRIHTSNIDLYDFKTCPAPLGQFMIEGYISNQKINEGYFGEFKGYYVFNEYAYKLDITNMYSIDNPVYVGLSAGKESGLTLSAMQGEWLLYKHLTDSRYKIFNVTYSIHEAGEFVAVIEADKPSRDIIKEVFDFDKRLKVVICGLEFSENPWRDISIFPFEVVAHRYTGSVKFENSGDKIGFLMLAHGDLKRTEL